MRSSSAAALCLKSAWKPNSARCSDCWRNNYLRTTLFTGRQVPKSSVAAVHDPMRAASARALLASSNFWSRSYSTAGLEAAGARGDAGGRMRVAEGAARRLRALMRNIESIRCPPPSLEIGHESSEDSTLRRRSPATARSMLGGPRTPVVGPIPSGGRRAHILRSPRDARDDIFVAGAPRRGAARAARCGIVPQHRGRRPGPPASDLRTSCTISEPIACAAPPPPRCA